MLEGRHQPGALGRDELLDEAGWHRGPLWSDARSRLCRDVRNREPSKTGEVRGEGLFSLPSIQMGQDRNPGAVSQVIPCWPQRSE